MPSSFNVTFFMVKFMTYSIPISRLLPVIPSRQAEEEDLDLGLLATQVDDGRPEEHGLVVGVGHDEEHPPQSRDHLESGVRTEVRKQPVAHQAKAQDGRQHQRQLFHSRQRGERNQKKLSSQNCVFLSLYVRRSWFSPYELVLDDLYYHESVGFF